MDSSTKKIILSASIGAAIAALVPVCICVDGAGSQTVIESLTYKLKITHDKHDKAKRTISISFPGLLSKENRVEAKRLNKETIEYADIDPEEFVVDEEYHSVDDEPEE